MCRGPCSYCGSPQVLVEHPKAPHPLGMFNLTQHLHCHRSFVLYMAVHTGQGEGAVRKCNIVRSSKTWVCSRLRMASCWRISV